MERNFLLQFFVKNISQNDGESFASRNDNFSVAKARISQLRASQAKDKFVI